MSQKSPSLPLVLVPELFRSTGGVQRYSLRFIEALDVIHGERVPVLSMNDRLEDFPADFRAGRQLHGCGRFSGPIRKILLAWKALCMSPSAILSTHPAPAPALSLLRKLRGVPFLCVAHGIDAWSLTPRVVRSLRQADLLLPVSRFTGTRLGSQLGANHPEISVLSNTVDGTRFHPKNPEVDWRERLGIPCSAKVLLSVCRISVTESGKGYDLVLESLPRLAKTNPDIVWVLAGTGNDLARVEDKARSLGVAERCRFPGFVPDAELPDLYRSSDLFVLPSRKEGFGIVFLEAAATGLPVIAGNRDGSVDALADGELGTLIDPDDSDALVAAIRTLLDGSAPNPHELHHACVARFGEDAFRDGLRSALTRHPRLSPGLRSSPATR